MMMITTTIIIIIIIIISQLTFSVALCSELCDAWAWPLCPAQHPLRAGHLVLAVE